MRSRNRILVVAMICWLPPCAGLQAADAPPGDNLAGSWQLFVDDYLIAESNNVERAYHSFEKHPLNPVEGIQKYGGRGTVLPADDGSGYRLWCRGGKTHYTSRDGLHWQPSPQRPPKLPGSHGCCSVVATPWEPDPAQRFKMVTKSYDEQARPDRLEKGGGWYGWHSADGIHWTAAGNAPLFPDRSDVGKFCWDPHRQRYFGTPKIWTEVRGHLRRCIGFSASAEFDAAWPTAELLLVPDRCDDDWCTAPGQHTQFYGLSAFAYETMYIGLLEVFRVTDGINDGPIQIELVTSRDGHGWQRAGRREPILAVGAPGAWDAGMIKTPNQPFVEGDTIKLFYGASTQTHGFGRSYHATRDMAHLRAGGTGLATLRKDGFASLDAGDETGSVTTLPLIHARGRLSVNYRARQGGWLKVEVLNDQGKTVPGYRREDCRLLTGNGVKETVTWNGRDELPANGRELRLRFLLANASLFSFHAGDGVRVRREPPPFGVLYTFEGKSPADVLTNDGSQAIFFQRGVNVDPNPQSAAFGTASVVFSAALGEPRNTLEIDDTFRLGTRFTLAAMVKATAPGRMRLFSAWEPYPTRVNEPPYERVGPVGRKELLFDFDAGAADSTAPGRLRLVAQGSEVAAPAHVIQGRYHHLAATCDDGAVSLYLDGRPIGQGRVPAGEVVLLTNLRVGEDPPALSTLAHGPTTLEQLIGNVDDVLVLGRALSPAEIRGLSHSGAARSLAETP